MKRMPTEYPDSVVNWDDLRFFIALVEYGTLSASARKLKVTHATMARRVANLEEALGAILFDQTAGGFKLTNKGKQVFDHAQTIWDRFSDIQNATESSDIEGRVSLSTTPLLCEIITKYLIPEIAEKYPGIIIEVVADKRNLSLARQETHLALRLARPTEGEYTAQCVGKVIYGLFGAQGENQEISTSTLVGFTDEFCHIAEAEWLSEIGGPERIGFRSNTLTCQKIAIESGVGIGILPLIAGSENSKLKRLGSSNETWSREVWLMMRTSMADVRRFRVVANHIASGFKRWISV